MAKVRLSLYECQEPLPPVCMVCGAEATETVSKSMSWNPKWVYLLIFVGLLPLLIVALVTTKRAKLKAPLCALHKGHWFKRSLILILCFLALLALVFCVIVVSDKPWVGSLVITTLVLFLGWLVLAVILSNNAIRPESIDDRDIVLLNVADGFVDAMVEFDREEDERPRRRSKRPRLRERHFDDDDSRSEHIRE